MKISHPSIGELTFGNTNLDRGNRSSTYMVVFQHFKIGEHYLIQEKIVQFETETKKEAYSLMNKYLQSEFNQSRLSKKTSRDLDHVFDDMAWFIQARDVWSVGGGVMLLNSMPYIYRTIQTLNKL